MFYRGMVAVLLGGLLSIAGIPSQAQNQAVDAPVTRVAVRHSEYDPREYRALRFANGLQVLLIRDTGAPTWVLSVNAGSLHDPAQVPDLARLAALSVTTASNRRDWVASTENLYTHFMFNRAGTAPVAEIASILSGVAPEQADIARAQQRLADEMRAARAITAADRRTDVMQTLLLRKPLSPGVLVTPSASLVPLEHVQDDLQAFAQRYFRPDRASLVVRTPGPLESLEAALRDGLANVKPQKSAAEPVESVALDRESLPLLVQAEIDGGSLLQLNFPVSMATLRSPDKPYRLVSYLLEHRGEGSLVSLLRSLGWAESIRTGFSELTQGEGVYTVSIHLTELGVKARDQISALVFYQLEQIRLKGLKAWRFNELAQSAEYDFLYHDWENTYPATELARRLHHVDAENVLFMPYLYGAYNEKLNRQFLEALRSDNALIMVDTGERIQGRQTVASRTSFQAEQASEFYPDIKLSIKRKLTFPEANNFIPKRLSMKESSLLGGTRLDGIDVLAQKPSLQSWYSRPSSLTMPTASVFIRLVFNQPATDADQAARVMIWSRLYRDALDEALYDAQVAGAEYQLLTHPLGLDIQLAGYNSQLGLMLNRMGQVYSEPWPLLQRWQQVRDGLVANLTGQHTGDLPEFYFDVLAQLHYQPGWSRGALLEALARQSQDSMTEIPQALRLEALFSGDLYRQEAQRLTALAEHYFLPKNAPGAKPAELVTAQDKALIAVARQSNLEVYVQAPGEKERDRVFVGAIVQLLDGELLPLISEGGEQNGPPIAVRATHLDLAGQPGLRLIASADVTASELLQAVRSRLSEPGIGARLGAIKRRWRHAETGGSESERAELLWRQLRKGYRGDERTAVAALNSSSLERYARELFGAEVVDVTQIDGIETYRKRYKTQSAGFNLP
ncbi:insulinase family protein [Gilvimarinus chinensis]|uniref:insulinase family protein n=1 Tax=Gilvimarinus chinensis TaxID=396005 RepID=UPI0003806908|nr:insulinase family protein [Gilvimarinus chinensis]